MTDRAQSYAEFAATLRAGHILACPTETQMGLLGDALSERAVLRVFAMKRRPAAEPLPVIAGSLEALEPLVLDFPETARILAARYWPGPLTLVLRARHGLPAPLLREGKLAVRVPGPSPALSLAQAFGGPLTATSANLSGQPPLVSHDDLRATFGAELCDVVPGTPPGGPPSTVVDASGSVLRVLRQGVLDLAPARDELGFRFDP
jgi:L-threonylcarbamoyladenylate synthase